MKMIFTVLAGCLVTLGSSVQSITIKGKVSSSDGAPVSDVAVSVKGTASGTSTDNKGFFLIKVNRLPVTLVFTSVGYRRVEHRVEEKDSAKLVQVTLASEAPALEEVVVTYSSKRMEMGDASASPSPVGTDKAVHKAGKATYKTTEKGFSRILTAGELNDFKKWKLWSDYNDAEFSSFSAQWLMTFRKRFCVQVQNDRHRPVVGEKLYLFNEDSRDTVWQAVTDNTGKAELWADQDINFSEQSNYSIICSRRVIRGAELFENGINRLVLKKDCSVSNAVDIAFIVDATGSMGDEIAYLQAELYDIIDKTSAAYKEVDLQLASVFYRDRGDEYLTRAYDFSSGAGQLCGFIKKQSARGGGDFPEAVEEALRVALDSLQWRSDARSKILFLVLDAPPHDAAKEKMKNLIQKASAMGIRIVPVACSGVNKSTEYLMRCAALATNGSYVFLTDDSGVGNSHIKPTTDEFKVELLNELLQRLIAEMIYTTACDEKVKPEPVTEDTVNTTVNVVVFPNPTQGKITIESTGKIQEVYVTDFTGKLLMKLGSSKNKRRWQVQLASYPSGTYLIKYFVEEKGWDAKKIVLIH